MVKMEDSESKIKTREEKLALAKKLAAPIISSSNPRFRENSLEGQGRIDECEHEKWLNYWKGVYDYWLQQVNLWEINEAACLLCGLNPDGFMHNGYHSSYSAAELPYACWIDGEIRSGNSELNKQFRKMELAIERGAKSKKLEVEGTIPYEFLPQTLIKWAIDTKINIPAPLVDWYEQQPEPEQPTKQTKVKEKTFDDELNEKSKRFYLGIIAALLSKPRSQAFDIHSTSAVTLFEGLVKDAGYSISNTKAREIINGLKDIETDKK